MGRYRLVNLLGSEITVITDGRHRIYVGDAVTLPDRSSAIVVEVAEASLSDDLPEAEAPEVAATLVVDRGLLA